ncbi:hypothetical protein RCH06_001868 [Polaromonas sp. CG_9.5]|uniref:hypothetical protein n=1 Tax=Polaromonas sp. CG_9.5 TaxID=3071705 RepID=UPI002E02C309|nr:hypothetical protein [Polaromonas sp. CG_9.5]
MPTMPTGLVPTVAAYSHDGPGGVLRTETAGGPSRYSVEYDGGTQRFSVTLVLDAGQLVLWVLFYTRTIKKGAVRFGMRLDSGLGTAEHQVNIVPGSYSATRTGGIVTLVSFVVEAQNMAYGLSDAAVAAYGLSAAALPAGFTPTVAAYSVEGAGGAVRDGIAGGVAAYALDYDRGLEKFSVTLMLTPDEFAVWTVWYHRLVGKGARSFTMPLDSGFGTAPHLCNIVPGSYSAARTGGRAMAVSFVVEAENMAYGMTDAEVDALISIYTVLGPDADALLARLERFATLDTLVLNF